MMMMMMMTTMMVVVVAVGGGGGVDHDDGGIDDDDDDDDDDDMMNALANNLRHASKESIHELVVTHQSISARGWGKVSRNSNMLTKQPGAQIDQLPVHPLRIQNEPACGCMIHALGSASHNGISKCKSTERIDTVWLQLESHVTQDSDSAPAQTCAHRERSEWLPLTLGEGEGPVQKMWREEITLKAWWFVKRKL